jgi:hypothetical protein
MKYVEILARNVYFSNSAIEYLNKLEERATNLNVRKWVKSNLRNWIINTLTLNKIIDVNNSDPKWVRDKYKTEDIFIVTPDSFTCNKISISPKLSKFLPKRFQSLVSL